MQFVLQSNFTHETDKQRWPKKDFEVNNTDFFFGDLFDKNAVLFV